ncbi:MAG: hypothetical protein KJO31_00820 [Gammaproteobacteria bacterium]|nr:hypothetical protein [Gammaproteobacteria bacterium]
MSIGPGYRTRASDHAGKCLATLACTLLTISPVNTVSAQSQLPAPLFAADDVLALSIEAPFTTIRRDRSETEYRDGILRYSDSEGKQHSLPLGLRTRGEYRRRKDVCDFPPIRLNFRKNGNEANVFAGQDRLKLVTHCKSGRGDYQQYVIKEYLAYRILATLTDNSFKTRLLRLTYIDTEKKKRQLYTKYAFLIEDKDELARRLGWKPEDVPRLEDEQLDRQQANLVNVFEYLIGNTDFSMVLGARDEPCCHNIVLYAATPGTFVPVPYDFDLAGLVNAPYATPNPKYKLKAVTQRLYRGFCRNNDLLPATLAAFSEKEAEIRRLVEEIEGLSGYHKRRITRFIDDFYEDFENERSIEKNFLRDCATG